MVPLHCNGSQESVVCFDLLVPVPATNTIQNVSYFWELKPIPCQNGCNKTLPLSWGFPCLTAPVVRLGLPSPSSAKQWWQALLWGSSGAPLGLLWGSSGAPMGFLSGSSWVPDPAGFIALQHFQARLSIWAWCYKVHGRTPWLGKIKQTSNAAAWQDRCTFQTSS